MVYVLSAIKTLEIFDIYRIMFKRLIITFVRFAIENTSWQTVSANIVGRIIPITTKNQSFVVGSVQPFFITFRLSRSILQPYMVFACLAESILLL